MDKSIIPKAGRSLQIRKKDAIRKNNQQNSSDAFLAKQMALEIRIRLREWLNARCSH